MITITILPNNEVRFSVGQDTIAVAGLVCYEPDDHDRMDVLANDERIKCPASVLPGPGAVIWAVTTTNAGCFWAYDLHAVHQYLKS